MNGGDFGLVQLDPVADLLDVHTDFRNAAQMGLPVPDELTLDGHDELPEAPDWVTGGTPQTEPQTPFGKARQNLARGLRANDCEMWDVYKANVAMYLYDSPFSENAKLDVEGCNQLADELLQLIFES